MSKLFSLGAGLLLLLAAAPTSTNYTLKTYDIGGSGGSGSSTNYKLNGTGGSQSGNVQSSTTYQTNTGNNNAQNANVPPAPTLTNPSSYYDRLQLIINTGNNPSDTKYLIAISSDNFTTTNYVQADHSVSSSQAIANYQTYTSWGGASGFLIVGLNLSTTYKVKVKALQGDLSGSAFGPTASAATVAPSLTMSLATSASSTPPFAISFPALVAGTAMNANDTILVGLTSNALSGGSVYVVGLNGGLRSASIPNTILSNTEDLSLPGSGYGAQVTSATQTSGGPFLAQSPYDGTGGNVGALTTSLQPILGTVGPLVSGSSVIQLKAKAVVSTPSAVDYSDTLTFVSAMNF